MPRVCPPRCPAAVKMRQDVDEITPPPEAAPPRSSRRARAALVRADSHPALLRLAKLLRWQLPGDERFGDPLSTAGETPAQLVGRQVSALEPDRPSAAHEVGLGALQLWQWLSEASGRGRGDEPVALLFTDLVKFSSWSLKAGDEATIDLLREVGVVVESSIAEHGGAITKRLGDGVMASFVHPQPAVEAALAAHAGVEAIEIAGYRPRMRAGVHYGRPRRLGGDYLGVDVNVAARVGAAAGPGRLLVSEPAFALLDHDRVTAGRSKALRASGVPKGLRVRSVSPRGESRS
jgi:adenylate cyclase